MSVFVPEITSVAVEVLFDVFVSVDWDVTVAVFETRAPPASWPTTLRLNVHVALSPTASARVEQRISPDPPGAGEAQSQPTGD